MNATSCLRNIRFIISAFLIYDDQYERLLERRHSIKSAGVPYEIIKRLVRKHDHALPLLWKKDKSSFFEQRLSNGKTVLDYCDGVDKDAQSQELRFHPNFNRLDSFMYTLPEYQRDIEMLNTAALNSSIAFMNSLTLSFDDALPHVKGQPMCKRNNEPLKNDLSGRVEYLFLDSQGSKDLKMRAKEIVARRNNYVHVDLKPKSGLRAICGALNDPLVKPKIRIPLSIQYAKQAAIVAIEIITYAFLHDENNAKATDGIHMIANSVYQLCGIDHFDLLVGFYQELNKTRPDFKWSVNYYVAKKLSRAGLTVDDKERISELVYSVPPDNASWWRAGLFSLLDDYVGTYSALLEYADGSGICKNELLTLSKRRPPSWGLFKALNIWIFKGI